MKLEIKDRDGDVIERRMLTIVTFETEGVSEWLPKILHCQANGIPLNATISSEQTIMDDIGITKS